MFLGVLGHVDLRWSANSCKLSTRCRLAMDFFTGVAELAEWWWFENSRVCLYYFFWLILCQSGSRLRVFARGCARALDGGRGFSCGLLFLIKKSRQFLGSSMVPFRFFVEGSILAQDERWRRA